ncbi:MAG: methionyl-tRNA formyltransferase [Pseudomonadota bacterium]|nr:methionyl-tRNA formyltransferase [Pseudomonadota bacterium]
MLRIVFAGTPSFAATALEGLLETGHLVVAAYTQPDRPAGRGRALRASPVKTLARAHQIPVHQPTTLKDPAEWAALCALSADVMVVAAYGLILPQQVLNGPRLGCLNIHASLLPRWRGAAPIQRALLAGDRETGVSIMQMDAGLDTGDVLARRSCRIAPQDTAGSLHDRLATLGSQALLEVLDQLESDTPPRPEPQPAEGASYAAKISKQEAAIDWTCASEWVDRLVRAFNPTPVAFTELEGQRVRIWKGHPEPQVAATEPPGTLLRIAAGTARVACGSGTFAIEQLQFAGGKTMGVEAACNAASTPLRPGVRFGKPLQ